MISTHESGIMLRVFEPTEESAIDVFAVPPIDDVLNEEEDDEKEVHNPRLVGWPTDRLTDWTNLFVRISRKTRTV